MIEFFLKNILLRLYSIEFIFLKEMKRFLGSPFSPVCSPALETLVTANLSQKSSIITGVGKGPSIDLPLILDFHVEVVRVQVSVFHRLPPFPTNLVEGC